MPLHQSVLQKWSVRGALNAARVAVENQRSHSELIQIKNRKSKFKNSFTLLAPVEIVKLRLLPARHSRARDTQLPPPLTSISSSRPISETGRKVFHTDH